MNTSTQTRITGISYEQTTCSRCGGEGRIQAFGHVHGGICFGCNGSGQLLTPKGRAAYRKAQAWKDEHLQIPVSSLVAGDRVTVTNMRGRRITVTVEAVDWCGHTSEEPDVRPCGAPIERWSREWKHRKGELDADHKAVPQAPVGPLDEALFLRADRYAATLAASVAADERITALTELVRQHEWYRTQAESQLSMVQEDPQFGTVWPQTGPEPDEDHVHALLCLSTGQIYRRSKWSHDWQRAHHDPQRATHYQWPIPDAGPFIAWRDGYGFDQVIKDAQTMATEFEELHRRWYGEPGYHDERGIFGRPRLAEADQRIRACLAERIYESNRKAQAAEQKLRQLRRLIEYLDPGDTPQWPDSGDDDSGTRDDTVIRLEIVQALLDRPDCGGPG